jgi:O-antigen/teichoic acid export membrane protein
MAGNINEVLDRILLKFTLGEEGEYYLGIYGANYKIAILLLLFVQMFRFAAEPFYFNYYKERDAKEVFAKIMRVFVGIGLLIILGVVVNIDVIKYFIDKKFFEGLEIVPWILFSYLFYGILFNLSIWYKLHKLTVYGALITITGAVITIVINLLLIKRLNYMACAYAHLASYGSMCVISYFIGRKYYKINYGVGKVVGYIVITLGIIYIYRSLVVLDDDIVRMVIGNGFIILFAVYLAFREKVSKNTLKALLWK